MTRSRPIRRVALAFLAHPDDAEILCAGTLLRLADIGWEIHIATASAGDCGSTTLPPDEIARIRRTEATDAAHSIGATFHCLGEHDVNVFFDKATNHKAIDLFRQVVPSLVFTHPRHDYMLDHEQVHLLARSASFSFPIRNASSQPLHDHSAVPWLYYCDPLDGMDPYSGDRVQATAIVDISAVIERKADMLSRHVSQREWLLKHHGMDEYIDSMRKHSSERGRDIGVAYAEAFAQHRGHAYPHTDLLSQLLEGQ
jgi:LmbE family N-acetylglucosaminyl deacetylase